MDRPDIYSQEQARSFDVQNGWRDALIAAGGQFQALVGDFYSLYTGLQATQTSSASLNINIASGQIYVLADVDATPWGALPADTNQVVQQGFASAQTIGLTNSLSGSNQQWALVQVQFTQADAIRAGDPDGGILPFYNSANPANPFQGPGNDGGLLPTVRQGLAIVSVVYGNAAGSAPVPPSPSGGCVPMYLILLTGGQETITDGQILQAGPLVYSGYPAAPLLAGLLNSHHGGVPGQGPKINAATELSGDIPLEVLPVTDSTNAGGLLSTSFANGFPGFTFTGNPNTGSLPGKIGDLYFDTVLGVYWFYNGSTWVDISGPPSGSIMMWYGAISTIPIGWYLCNGQVTASGLTTPNLQGMFVIGAGNSSANPDGFGVIAPNTTTGATSHLHFVNLPETPYTQGTSSFSQLVSPSTYETGNASSCPAALALCYIMKN